MIARLVLLAVLAIFGTTPSVAAGSTNTPAGRDAVIDCHVFAHYPNVLISSARNMTCRAAAREMRRYRGSIKRRFRTPGRFACSRVSGNSLGGQWRCVRGIRAFRFEFGD
jgi:hypothetical protein